MSHILDLACRNFWHITGRRVNTTGAESWLDAPISHSSHVGGDWVAHELARHGGVPATTTDDAGLLGPMSWFVAGAHTPAGLRFTRPFMCTSTLTAYCEPIMHSECGA